MQNIIQETQNSFEDLGMNLPKSVVYQIKDRNGYEKAKTILVKSVAFDNLQAPDCLEASSTCKTISEAPLPMQKMRNDSL